MTVTAANPATGQAGLNAAALLSNNSPQFASFTNLTPVQRGQLLAHGDHSHGAHSNILTPVQQGEALRQAAPGSTSRAAGANNSPNIFPNTPVSDAVSVKTEVTPGLHGRTRTIHTMTIRANYKYDGVGAAPGDTIQAEAARARQAIEGAFQGSYTDALGNETIYQTRVDLTISKPSAAGRMDIAVVHRADPRLEGPNFIGPAEPGNLGIALMDNSSGTVLINERYDNKTIEHEVGHILGLRHNFEFDQRTQSCAPVSPGQQANLMTSSGCSVGTNHRRPAGTDIGQADFRVTQSQLQQVFDRHKASF